MNDALVAARFVASTERLRSRQVLTDSGGWAEFDQIEEEGMEDLSAERQAMIRKTIVDAVCF